MAEVPVMLARRQRVAMPASVALALLVADDARASSITLYGIVDASFVYTRNGSDAPDRVELQSGSLSGSRVGMKGEEPLGGGGAVLFQLENGFNVVNGRANQGGRLFGRQSYAGLRTRSGHTLVAGRTYDPLTDLVQPLQGDGYLGQTFSTPGDVDNADSSARLNHALKWSSPRMAGWQVSAVASLGGVPGATGSGLAHGAALSYRRGPFAAAGGYLRVDLGNPSHRQRGLSSADSLFNSAVNAAYVSSASVQIVRVATQYVLDAVTVGAYYSDARYRPDGESHFVHTQVFRNASVYGIWQATPVLTAMVAYNQLHASGNSTARYRQLSAGANLLFSKRTDLYAMAGYVHAHGTNGNGAAEAVVGATGANAGGASQLRLNAGLRHRF
ncbi:porin [Burkholderia lata]|uniref:Porin n=1 Tax=Burkholderia lata (strain ATCC 17760 / DSM 23089 / LMG 22485 / NCIMB 9086 / R18194 / 383) TaxID=482957 RepID=A0A6P2V2H7_BURL3|nr:porin [Burkholderia lata]VWC76117.1 porin [Burkholderia lata]